MKRSNNRSTSPPHKGTIVDTRKKKILIISYFINENGMACSHHIDDRIALFRKSGYEPVILSSLCVPQLQDYLHHRIPSISPSGLRFELRQLFRRKGPESFLWKARNIILFPLLPFYGLERMFLRIDTIWYWFSPGLWKGKKLCKTYPFSFIYSTGGPAVSHSIAHRLKQIFNIPWIAEVQDPLIHGYCANTGKELKLLEEVERETYTHADRMVFLTQQAMKATEKRLGTQGNGTVIYPGAPTIHLQQTQADQHIFLLGHFGSLGGVRNLKGFIQGMELAIKKAPTLIDVLKVDLYGNVGKDDRERIQSSSYPEIFSSIGLVSRKEALIAMGRCSALLLIQGEHAISTETIPSKVYEYLQVGRPILALVHNNPELKEMLMSMNHFPTDTSPENICETLLRLYQNWRTKTMRPTKYSPYTIQNAVDQIINLAPAAPLT